MIIMNIIIESWISQQFCYKVLVIIFTFIYIKYYIFRLQLVIYLSYIEKNLDNLLKRYLINLYIMLFSFLHGAYLSSFHQKFDEPIANPILSLNPYVICKKLKSTDLFKALLSK